MDFGKQESIRKLVALYQASRQKGDKNSVLIAEGAMADFMHAEAAVTRMLVAEAIAAQLNVGK